jgi:hypothetical protein
MVQSNKIEARQSTCEDKFRKKVGRKRMLVADRGIIVGFKAVFMMVTG